MVPAPPAPGSCTAWRVRKEACCGVDVSWVSFGFRFSKTTCSCPKMWHHAPVHVKDTHPHASVIALHAGHAASLSLALLNNELCGEANKVHPAGARH